MDRKHIHSWHGDKEPPERQPGPERPKEKQHMLTILLIFVLMPVLVFLELTIQRRLFKNSAARRDSEWELYRQRWD